MAGNLSKEQQDQKDYQDYLEYQHYLQASAQAANPQVVPDAADKEANGKMPQNASLVPRGAAQQDIKDLQGMDPRMKDAFAKGAVAIGTGGLAAGEAAGMGMLGRAAVNAGAMGLQKYLGNAIDKQQDRTQGVPASAAIGGVMSLGADAVGKTLGKLGDYLMQKGVGMNKYLPGAGTRLADQGLLGTKEMLKSQVAERLPQAESAVQDVIQGVPGRVDAQEISDALSSKGSKFILSSSGEAGPQLGSYLDKVKSAAEEFKSMGEGAELSPHDLLELKRQGDWLGYTASGTPATSLEAELGQTQADKARELLNTLSEGKSTEALANEQALVLARNALKKSDTIHQGMGSGLFFSKLPGQSIAATGLGQTGVTLGRKATRIADPEVLQSLFGLTQSTPKNPPSE